MTTQQQEEQEQYSSNDYEYQQKKLRRAYIDLKANRHAFTVELEKMLDIIFSRNPNWSVKRALQRIIHDNPEMETEDLGHLYDFVRQTKHGIKIQKKKLQNGNRLLQNIDPEVEADGKNVRENNDIDIDETPAGEGIDKRYLILQDKCKKLTEQVEDLKEQLKRNQQKSRFFNHGEIRLDYNKLQQCLRECNESPDAFIITQEKGNAIGVRAA